MIRHHYATPIRPSRIVIVGSSGFIGSCLTKHFASLGVEIVGINSKELGDLDANSSLYIANLLKPEDVVIVLAAITPDKSKEFKTSFIQNIKIAKILCDALKINNCSHLIYISSDSVYKYTDTPISEKTAPEPESLYGMMHLMRENMLLAEVKMPILLLRLTQVYGDGDTHNSYGPCQMLRAAIGAGNVTLLGAGEETRDHIYIDDVIKLIDIMVNYKSEGLINIASGFSISFSNLAETIKSLFDKIHISSSPKERVITYRQFDNSIIKENFQNFTFTNLKEGLIKMKCDLMQG